MSSYWIAVLQLFISGVIWGSSFTMMKWGLEDFTSTQLLFWRFLIAFAIGESLLFLFKREVFKKSHSDIKHSMWVGLVLGFIILLQLHGLNYTTATKSAFITSTYVVIIPFVSFIFYKIKPRTLDIFVAFIALVGMGLLLDLLSSTQSNLNFGDILTILCAIASAFHIIMVGLNAKNCVSGFRFNTYQIFWSLLFLLPFLGYELKTKSIDLWPDYVGTKSLIGVLLLAVLVSIVAFYFQIQSQKRLPTTTASMMCLLEAPFSFIFASMLLNEKLTLSQGIGALIIISAAALSVYFESRQPKTPIIPPLPVD